MGPLVAEARRFTGAAGMFGPLRLQAVLNRMEAAGNADPATPDAVAPAGHGDL